MYAVSDVSTDEPVSQGGTAGGELPIVGLRTPWLLSRALRAARKRLEMTQLELANLAGVSRGTVGRAEDSGAVSVSALCRLLQAVGYIITLQPSSTQTDALERVLDDHRSGSPVLKV